MKKYQPIPEKYNIMAASNVNSTLHSIITTVNMLRILKGENILSKHLFIESSYYLVETFAMFWEV